LKIVTPKDPTPDSYKSSIFLAGPIPRGSYEGLLWQDAACGILGDKGYDGVVFVPCPYVGDYSKQVEWEDEHLNMADCILFWVPRSKDLPGFTTNVEFGEWMKSGKVILGAPHGAERIRYLTTKAAQYGITVRDDLEITVDSALDLINKGWERTGGERHVPLNIWRTASFQSWYKQLKVAGNRLDGAKVEWVFRAGPGVFAWAMHVNIHVTSENRNKSNEFIFSRPDICAVLAHTTDNAIIFIKEFRSPCSNSTGFVTELPSGSSKTTKSMLEAAYDEFSEETGFKFDINRLEYVESRQMAATLSTHKVHLFDLPISQEEYLLIGASGKAHGVEQDTERTSVTGLWPVNVLNRSEVDWGTLGMVAKILWKPE